MSTFVMAHGDRIEGEAKTFVPEGTTVRFYGRDGAYLGTTAALAGLASGAGGSPTDSYASGAEIWNYHLYAEDDRGIAQYMTVDPGGHTMVFCGPNFPNDTPLCKSVLACQQHGAHTCDGVLGRYSGDLVVLACRGVDEAVGTVSDSQFGGDADDPLADLRSEMGQWVTAFLERAKADPDAAEVEFDGLPQGTLAMLNAYPSVRAWTQAKWVRWYAQQDDLEGYIGQVTNGAPAPQDQVATWFQVPVYRDSLVYLLYVAARAMVEPMLEAARNGTDPTAIPSSMDALEQQLAPATSRVQALLGTADIDSLLAGYGPMQELKATTLQQLAEIAQAAHAGQASEGTEAEGEEP
jgi:hypothetical protein